MGKGKERNGKGKNGCKGSCVVRWVRVMRREIKATNNEMGRVRGSGRRGKGEKGRRGEEKGRENKRNVRGGEIEKRRGKEQRKREGR